MPAPVISWWDEANQTQQTAWQVGTVDAGTISPDRKFLLWNNRGGAAAVSDATNCALTTKDSAGGDTGELVTQKWCEVKIDELGETRFTAIGGATTKQIGNGISPGVLSGAANDGTLAKSDPNYALFTAHLNVPATATAGNISFLLRLLYQYV